MKRSSLPVRWVRWRRRRYQALSAHGLAGDLAWRFADAEARGRRRIAAIVGYTAARDAELEWMSDGGELRFVLTGDLSALTEKQRASLEQKNCRSSAA